MSKPVSRSAQLLRDRFDRTDAAAKDVAQAERLARLEKTERLKAERLARERASEEDQKRPAPK